MGVRDEVVGVGFGKLSERSLGVIWIMVEAASEGV
jgi:hypothetical protein